MPQTSAFTALCFLIYSRKPVQAGGQCTTRNYCGSWPDISPISVAIVEALPKDPGAARDASIRPSLLMKKPHRKFRTAACLLLLSASILTTAWPLRAEQTKELKPTAPGDETFDVDALFKRSIVIDGNANYYSFVSHSEIGRPDFSKDMQGLTVKEATGIDIGGITLGKLASLHNEGNLLKSGRYRGAMLIRTAADIDEAVRQKKYGVMFYAQRHYPLNGGIESIRKWHDDGLRIFQLQYSANDGNQEPGERLGGGPTQKGGLTELGTKVVHELLRLGMVVDLAHCNTQTTIEAAEIAKLYGVPVTANHVGARDVKTDDGKWLARYARNATAEKMLAVKETGGVVGVMAYGPYLRGPYQKLRMTPPEFDIPHATIDDLVAHIDHIVKLIGVDHVGLSTDGYLDGTMAHGRKGDGILDGPRRWKEAMRRLHDMGYSEADLQKIMGMNFLRVYRQALKPAKPLK